jgi:arylsulfatase A-like enzyme
VQRIDFTAASSGIRTGDADFRIENGQLVVDCRGRRAWVEVPVDADAARFNVVEVVLVSRNRSHHSPLLRWIVEGGEPSADREAKFPPQAGLGDRARYLVHVERSAGWRGRIRALRLFPTDNPGRVTVESIRLLALPLGEILGASGGGDGIRSFRIASETRRGFYLPAGETREETCPDAVAGARLEFAFGVPEYRWKSLRGPVRLRLEIGAGGGSPRTLWEGELDGRTREEDRGWREVAVPIPGDLEAPIRLRWECEAAFEAPGEVPLFVAHPAVVPPVADPARRNVLLVSLDTLRADHVGAHGYPGALSPVLDRFARESTAFRQAKSQAAKTLPSHMTIFTSLYPGVHGAIDETDRLADGWPTLAGALGDAGYHTAAFTEDAFVSGVFGFTAGFDRYHDGTYHLLEGSEEARGGDVRTTVARAVRFLERSGDRPFFLFVHTYQPHTPYCPEAPFAEMFREGYEGPVPPCAPESFLRNMQATRDRFTDEDVKRVRSLYAGEVRFTDSVLGELLGALDRLGLADRTLVVITSDHGEDFEDHRALGRHGHTLYEELLHVPLLVRAPGLAGPGGIVDEPVGLIDLGPTLLDLLDLDAPETFQGHSFAGRIDGRATLGMPVTPRPAIAENRSLYRRVSVQDGPWKYIRNVGWNPEKAPSPERLDEASRAVYGSDVAEELYRLDVDPGEKRNRISEGGDAAAAVAGLRSVADRFLRLCEKARSSGPARPSGVSVDPEILDKLRELGYMEEQER